MKSFEFLVYLHLRASRHGICYPPQNEMLHELGLASTKHLRPHIKTLEDKRFISTHSAPETGKIFYLVHDPRVANEYMVECGELRDEEIFAISDLCEDLGQQPVSKELIDIGHGKRSKGGTGSEQTSSLSQALN